MVPCWRGHATCRILLLIRRHQRLQQDAADILCLWITIGRSVVVQGRMTHNCLMSRPRHKWTTGQVGQ